MSGENPMQRLERAMELWIGYQAGSEEGTEAEFLARHPDLRDLLEPLLNEDEDEAAIDPEGDQLAGRVLGDFRLRREIGRGGMGVVYDAWQASLDRRVAVKVLPPHLAQNPKSLARFKQEATTAAKLKHPGIVDIVAVGAEDGLHYIAMKFIEGAPLDKVIAESSRHGLAAASSESLRQAVSVNVHGGDLTELVDAADADVYSSPDDTWVKARDYVQTVVDLAAQVADALHFAHEAGVIHRDVKPSNVLIQPNGKAVLTDFGLAREQDMPALTLSGEFAGTPYYVSPEQALGRRSKMDRRTDIFSLGVTIYELLTHRRPFDGDTTHAVLQRILHKDPVDPQRLNPSLAPDLVAIVLKALEKEPTRRYATAAEFASDLRNFLAYRPVSAHRLTRMRRLRRWVRREPLKAALVSTLVLAVPGLSGLGGFVWATQDERAAGERALEKERFESAVREAFIAYVDEDMDAALVRFDVALAIQPDSIEALAGKLLCWRRKQQAQQMLDFLQHLPKPVVTSPALQRLRLVALKDLGKTEEVKALGKNLPPRVTGVDFFISGMRRFYDMPHAVDLNSVQQAALTDYSRAIARSERPPAIYYYMLLSTAEGLEKYDVAAEYAKSIELLWPDAPHSYRWLAIGFRNTDLDKSLHYHRKAVAAAPDDYMLLLGLAETHRRHKQFAEAEKALVKASTMGVDPTKQSIARRRGQIKMQMKDFDAAERFFKQAVQEWPSTMHCWVLGQFYAKTDRPELAVEAYRKAARRNPKHWMVQKELGQSLFKLDRHAEALGPLRAACKLNPDYGFAYFYLGATLSRMKKHGPAAAAFKRAAEIMPDHAPSHFWHAHQHHRRRDWRRCEEPLRKAIGLRKNYVEALSLMGTVLMRLDRPMEADRYNRLTLELKPTTKSWFRQVAGLYTRNGRYIRSAILLRRMLVEKEPKKAWAHSELVDTLTVAEDWAELRRELLRWTRVHPDSARAWRELAAHLLSEDTPEEWRTPRLALRAAQRVVGIDGRDSAAALALLADAQHAMGDPTSAIGTAEEALGKIKGDPQLRKRLQARLALFRKK